MEKEIQKLAQELYTFLEKRLKIEKAPKFKFLEDEENSQNSLGTTGYYNPKTEEISIFCTNRHPKDILRSLSHEIIHHHQKLQGHFTEELIDSLSNKTYAQENQELRKLEKEAYEIGNILFRDWENERRFGTPKNLVKESLIVLEGGAAAKSLIGKKLVSQPDNQGRELYYGKIKDSELNILLPDNFGTFPDENESSYIGNIIYVLGNSGLIDKRYMPSFSLGSTRLAALKYYGREFIDVGRYEVDDIINSVSSKKTEYGDLDIDLVFTGTKKEIVSAIESINPAIYAAAVLGGEVNIAIRIGEKVVQVDLVNVAGKRDAFDFMQHSSFIDLDNNIKGVFQKLVLSSLLSVTDQPDENSLESIEKFVKANGDTPFSLDFKKKIEQGYTPVRTRLSVSLDGANLVVDFVKTSKKNPDRKTTAKLRFGDEAKYPIKDLDKLAKIVFKTKSADASLFKSAVKMTEFVANNFSAEKKNEFWGLLQNAYNTQLQRRANSSEYLFGIKALSKILGVSYLEDVSSGTKKRLRESSRESIGRFVGKNKFAPKKTLEILRTIVAETGREGRSRIRLDLRNNPKIDLVEKMDSSFCTFGILPSKKFFMESSNSGVVTSDNLKRKFEFLNDFYQSFIWLLKNKSLQKSLMRIYDIAGPFKYEAELLPVLTHKGSPDGNITFSATPYSKSKLGSAGAFVIFKAKLFDGDLQDWVRPPIKKNTELVSMIKNLSQLEEWGKKWNVYTNESDLKHPVIFDVSFDEVLTFYLSSEEKYKKGIAVLSSKKDSPQKQSLKDSLEQVAAVVQKKLDDYANRAKSRLGGENSYIEGVVLRIKRTDGAIFEVKGTSKKFGDRKDFLWGPRADIFNLERDFVNTAFTQLGAKTTNPAKLNKIIRQVSSESSFREKKTPEQRKERFFTDLILNLFNTPGAEAPNRLFFLKVIDESRAKWKNLFRQFEQSSLKMDVDTKEKTANAFANLKEKFDNFEERVNESYRAGIEFLLTGRAEKIIDFGFENLKKGTKNKKRVLIWSGRAQPWHKGHHAMIEKGKSLLNQLSADKILIVIVKGGKTSSNLEDNPLQEDEQINFISSLYESDPLVEVSKEVAKNSFIGELGTLAVGLNLEIAGWLAGADRIIEYKRMLSGFNTKIFMKTHKYLPFATDDNGKLFVSMIETPRVLSGTRARGLVRTETATSWVNQVAPEGLDVDNYVEIYKVLRARLGEETPLEEISAMAAGVVSGAPLSNKKKGPTLFRERMSFLKSPRGEFYMAILKERELRKRIRSLIQEKGGLANSSPEQRFRSIIRKMILREASSDAVTHFSTGINVLETLLKKVIPIVEIDFKQLTTDKIQRDSFRAHIINGVQRTLKRVETNMAADPDKSPNIDVADQPIEIARDEPELEEAGSPSLGVKVSSKEPQKDEKFIDVSSDAEKGEEKKLDRRATTENEFALEGHEDTGRKIAFQSYQKVEKDIIRAFEVLAFRKDRNTFFEYLITNLKLYFDKFEEEMSAEVPEPTTNTYEKEPEATEF